VTKQTKEFINQTKNRSEKPAVLMHDRDTKFSRQFVAALKANGIRSNALPIASPNLNGRVERFVQTIKHECLFRFILFGQKHVDHIVREWVTYYNTVRSHTQRENLPPLSTAPPSVCKVNRHQIVVRSYVGGLVKSFERQAA
jgi:putative transposase